MYSLAGTYGSSLVMDVAAVYALAATAICFLIFLKRYNRRPSKLPPSLPGLPLIGHLHLVSDMPHHKFTQMSRLLGPIFCLRLGQVTTVVVNSAHFAKIVLKTQDHVFCDRPQLISAQYLSFGCSDITFSSYGSYWRQARKICVSELLSPRRVTSFGKIRKEEVDRMLATIMGHEGKDLDISKLLFNLSNDVVCRVAFGKRFEEEDEEKGGLANVLKETQELFAGFCLGDFFPKWRWVNFVTGYESRLLKTVKKLGVVCDDIIARHKRRMEAGCNEEDFVDVLLRVQKRRDLEVPITDDNLKALVLDMFVAGTDTTSATLEWTMTELVRHPEVMERVQLEVRNAGELTEKDLPNLRYMRAVIKESMRLHPAVPLLVPRESMERSVVEGYELPEKTRILINTYAIGRDPNSWKDPLAFRPERFLVGEEEMKDYEFRFLPFGGGRRGCPGYAFGMATIEMALARLLYHFEWALPDGVDGDTMDVREVFGLATRKKSPLIVVPKAAISLSKPTTH